MSQNLDNLFDPDGPPAIMAPDVLTQAQRTDIAHKMLAKVGGKFHPIPDWKYAASRVTDRWLEVPTLAPEHDWQLEVIAHECGHLATTPDPALDERLRFELMFDMMSPFVSEKRFRIECNATQWGWDKLREFGAPITPAMALRRQWALWTYARDLRTDAEKLALAPFLQVPADVLATQERPFDV